MINATILLIGKILLMMLIIGGMVMILMSIGHLFRHDDLNTSDDDLRLRDEIDNEENVVGEKSVFYNFLVKAEKEKPGKDKEVEQLP